MKPINEDLLEALRSIADGCARWVEEDPRISVLAGAKLVMWQENRPEFVDDVTSGPGWVLTCAGEAYLAGYAHRASKGA